MSIAVSDEGVKKIVKKFLKGETISKWMSSSEYNRLTRFINGDINIDADVDGISHAQLFRVLLSLDIRLSV